MGKMPRKIIRTKLFARISAIFQQVLRPFFQYLHMGPRKICIPVHAAHRRRHDEHIPALFHRHLIFEIINPRSGRILVKCREHLAVPAGKPVSALFSVHSVNLPPRVWIASHIMRRKIILPYVARRKFKYGAKHSLYILRIVQQKQRNRRIADIYRTDAAVGIVFL